MPGDISVDNLLFYSVLSITDTISRSRHYAMEQKILCLPPPPRPRANMVKILELMSGIISQTSEMKPLFIELLTGNYLRIKKEHKWESIIVLAKLEHIEVVF